MSTYVTTTATAVGTDSEQVELGRRPKDWAISGAILATAAFFWFGWAQMSERFTLALGLGAGLAIVTAIAAFAISARSGGPVTMNEDSTARRAYGTWVGIEFLVIFLGAGALGGTGHTDLLPAWVLLVVGLHFIPLARAFRLGALTGVGVAAATIAVVAGVLDLTGVAPAPLIAGGLGGALLVLSGILMVMHALRLDRTLRHG